MLRRKLKGAASFATRIRRKAAAFPGEVEQALYLEAQIEMTEAKRRTPVDTGALRASGTVHPPERKGRSISVTLSFGGDSETEAYAVPVHEDLEAFHEVGQAKYLESVLNESAAHMSERLTKRMRIDEERD